MHLTNHVSVASIVSVSGAPMSASTEEFSASVGTFILSWAELELWVDLIVLKISHLVTKPSGNLKHQWSEKFQFVNKHSHLIQDQVLSNKLRQQMLKANKLVDDRHDFIHAAAVERIIRKNSLNVTFARLLQPNKKDRRLPRQVSAEDIDNLTNKIQQVVDELVEIASSLSSSSGAAQSQ